MQVIEDIRELIGHTPLLRLRHFPLPEGVKLYAKLESFNPGGSIKDRCCLSMLREAQRSGKLHPGATIIEPTAGNTGIGLAIAALNQGLRVIFVVPKKFSQEKQELMRALGGEIINTPTEEGIEGAINKAKELSAEIPNSFIPNQFYNPANPLAHYESTGPELFQQLDGKLDYFLAGVGSGGTFSGVARFLKEQNPAIQTLAVEPEGSILGGGKAGPHNTEGIGVDFIPAVLDTSVLDGVITVSDQEAFEAVKELALKEGLLVGSSSGAAFVAAYRLACSLKSPASVATIFPDGSERYFSKHIYQGGI